MTSWEFIETTLFAKRVGAFLDPDEQAVLREELAQNPYKGSPIPGCGGIRKLRVAIRHRGKGKRGGARVLYLALSEANRLYLITIYGKDEQENLTAEDKRLFRQLAHDLKSENKRSKGS